MFRKVFTKLPSNTIKIIGAGIGIGASYHYIHNRFSEKKDLPQQFGARHSVGQLTGLLTPSKAINEMTAAEQVAYISTLQPNYLGRVIKNCHELTELIKLLCEDAFVKLIILLTREDFNLQSLIRDEKDIVAIVSALKDHKYSDLLNKHLIKKAVNDLFKEVKTHTECLIELKDIGHTTYRPFSCFITQFKEAGLNLDDVIRSIPSKSLIKKIDTPDQLYNSLTVLSFKEQVTFFNQVGKDHIQLLLDIKFSSDDTLTCLVQLNTLRMLRDLKSNSHHVRQIALNYISHIPELKENSKRENIISLIQHVMDDFHHVLKLFSEANMLNKSILSDYVKLNKPNVLNELIIIFNSVNYLTPETFQFIVQNHDQIDNIKRLLHQLDMLYIDRLDEDDSQFNSQKQFLLQSVMANIQLLPTILSDKTLMTPRFLSYSDLWDTYIKEKLSGKSVLEPEPPSHSFRMGK